MATIKELHDACDSTPEGKLAANLKATGRIVIDDFDDALRNLLDKGLVVRNGDNVEITTKGALFFEEERMRRKIR